MDCSTPSFPLLHYLPEFAQTYVHWINDNIDICFNIIYIYIYIFLLKKIKDTKGTFHAKKGTIKDRNGMDLTEAEDTKKRWQEYTEEVYKKIKRS